MLELGLCFALGFAVSVLSGLFYIPMLRRLKMSQKILEIGPKWHMSKQGTPSMGGLLFITGTVASLLLFGLRQGDFTWLAILGYALLNSVIGVIDDMAKIRKKQNQGLTVLQKLFLQLAVSSTFIALLFATGVLQETVSIPFTDWTVAVPRVFYIFLAILFNTFVINAVNFTDGIDGLCGGVTLPIAVFFAVFALSMEEVGLGLFPAALAGGVLGFLVYNFHPAKVWMGDTGSLFLGGAVCGMAFAFNRPLWLVILGAFYILESVSVVLQVAWYKISGKRIFKMAPIHHHFEMCGWSETKLFFVFSIGTVALCALVYYLG